MTEDLRTTHGECPVCGRTVRLRKNGRLWSHRADHPELALVGPPAVPLFDMICRGSVLAPLAAYRKVTPDGQG